MDQTRRNLLATGVAATAMAAVPQALAQQAGQGVTFFERSGVRLRYEQSGSGFPLLAIAGEVLNSVAAGLRTAPFKPLEEFKSEYRVIAADLRNANPGQSAGPLAIDRPWDSHTDDQFALMDHLGIGKFMLLGFASAALSPGT